MGASCREQEKRNGEIKGSFHGREGDVRSGGGSEPFLFKWFNWFNINISIASIAISVDSPFLVATLGRYFTTLVWHPFPDPPPALSRSTVRFKGYDPHWACQVCRCDQTAAFELGGGKLPDERKCRRPNVGIIRQGLHPHPGPVWQKGGFDDSQASDWDESDDEEVEGRSSNGWPLDDNRGSGMNGDGEEVEEQLFALGQEQQPSNQCL